MRPILIENDLIPSSELRSILESIPFSVALRVRLRFPLSQIPEERRSASIERDLRGRRGYSCRDLTPLPHRSLSSRLRDRTFVRLHRGIILVDPERDHR